jgi:hypothetical protein
MRDWDWILNWGLDVLWCVMFLLMWVLLMLLLEHLKLFCTLNLAAYPTVSLGNRIINFNFTISRRL